MILPFPVRLCLLGSFLICLHHISVAQNNEGVSLQKALQTARTNNPVLKAQMFDVYAGQADIVTSKLRPNLNLNNQTLQLANSKYYPENTQWSNPRNRQVWWQLTKPIQLPNQKKWKIETANKSFDVLNRQYLEAERNLFFDVANKWLDVWTLQKQAEVIAIAEANADTLAKKNELRLKNQVISETDYIRTQLLSEQYQVQRRTALQELRSGTNELKLLLGATDSIHIDPQDTLIFFGQTSLDSLLAEALNNRPDISMTRSMITVSESNIRYQRSLAWPQPELGAIWNPQNTVPYVGIFGTVQVPLFSRNQGQIQKSILQKQQAQQTLHAVEMQIENEVTTAYNAYVIQKDNIHEYNIIAKRSEKILSSVRYSYLRGGTSIIDFLEAQRSWVETQQQYYDAQQRYRKSYIQVLFATGLINKLAQ
jgi:cobalt-zinc-cadmium efflux system outer membrane protein